MIKLNKVGSIGFLSFSSLRVSVGYGMGFTEHDEIVKRKVLVVLGEDRIKKYQLAKDSSYNDNYLDEVDQECLDALCVE